MAKISAAFSPCPNDTFLFHAWVTGRVGQQVPIHPVLADIQKLNEWGLQAKFPLIKVSMHCLGHILNDYHLLPVGCALGHGLGPKLIAKKNIPFDQLSNQTIAIPGKDTTANLLFDLLMPQPRQKIFTSYEQVVPMVLHGEADAGIIIHETRFTFAEQGLVELADLGDLWKTRYGVPLPLGGIVARRSLNSQILHNLTQALQESLISAWLDPQASARYVMKNSQEKQSQVVGQHITTYVTQDTFQLSSQGIAAIDTLLRLGREKNLIPQSNMPWLAI